MLACLTAAAMLAMSPAPLDQDARAVAALDTAYQAAVERNDAEGMAAILHPRMTLVVGSGQVFSGEDLMAAARSRDYVYEHQVEDAGTQTVRMLDDHTAIVTARLWLKGTHRGTAFDRRLWFSDTYVKTPEGWKYAFGQSSIALPNP